MHITKEAKRTGIHLTGALGTKFGKGGSAVAQYYKHFTEQMADKTSELYKAIDKLVQSDQAELMLICSCKPFSCHGDVIKMHLDKVINNV